MPIRSAAVLGAGTMGAQIAAHLANAGVRVALLDVTQEAAAAGLKRATTLKPDPFFTRETLALITAGGFDGDLASVSAADWIIEAVVEQLEVKQSLFARIEAVRRADAIVSSNTSGIPIAALAHGRDAAFRRHFLGTHFFNPPRYLKLVEVIPTAETDPRLVERLSWFIDRALGKGVVRANDAPGFIANRIGLFGLTQLLRVLQSGAYTIEEIDAITGPPIGRPKSATFRTLDIAGLDIVEHVTRDLARRLPDDSYRSAFELPPVVRLLLDKGWVGEKAGQGFYKRVGAEILTLDPGTLSYRAKQAATLPALEQARGIEDVGERIRTLFNGTDRVGALLRETLAPTLVYSAVVANEVAGSLDDIDRAMRWGFGWELGPFETIDAIGVDNVLRAVPEPLRPSAPLLETPEHTARPHVRNAPLPVLDSGLQILKAAKERLGVLQRNGAASLVDLGDGVLAVELHSKMNIIGGDTIEMLRAGVKEATANFQALVIGTDAVEFSAGANLMLVLLQAQEGNWDEIDLMVRTFQQTTLSLKYCEVPVVVATNGVVLGGGCEIALHADRIQAAGETYMGLVEVGVGLIPAGGGTKEMLARTMRAAGDAGSSGLEPAQRVFETIAFGKVSTSAGVARQLGYLRDQDQVTMNRDRVMADAKTVALDRARTGYRRPAPAPIAVGGESVEAALKLGVHLAWRAGRASDHDAVIGRALAHIVAGGALPHATTVSEAHLLDLEREAFLKLCGEAKTLARIQHTLKTGKPLRN